MSAPKYRWHHQKIRAALLPQAYGKVCHLCGWLMLPGQLLDLDHDVTGQAYRGMAHRRCNRREGAIRGNRMRLRKRRSVIFP
jgi:Recombination endonuclease VII